MSIQITPPPGTGASAPTGTVVSFAGASAPTGWLMTDGSAISRTTYAALFAVIGTTFGVGDGSTTFNIPNTQGIFIRSAGTQTFGGVTYMQPLGAKTIDQMQGHVHQSSYGLVGQGASGGAYSPGSGQTVTSGGPITDGTHGTPRTGTETQPANIVLNHIIKF